MSRHFIVICIIFLFSQILFAQLVYFQTYEENRQQFLDLTKDIYVGSWSTTSDQNLKTDLALIKAQLPTDSLIVFSSGLHGIEGYVGSSVQRWLIPLLKSKKELKSDVLMIHTLNPWGMKNNRRVNENNVDLNRNFSNNPQLYQTQNESYLPLNSFLNPTEKLELHFFHRFRFLFSSVSLILEYSIETLRKSILLGQYNQPKGLYYGGSKAENLQSQINLLLKNQLSSYKKILWIDLHTGYGEKGQLHLLLNDSESEDGKRIQKIFSSRKIDFGNQRGFYKTKGDLISYLSTKSSPQQEISAVVFGKFQDSCRV